MSRRMLLASVALVGALAILVTALALKLVSPAGAERSGTGAASQAPQFRFSFGQGSGPNALGNPLAIIEADDELYVSDAQKARISVFKRDGTFVRSIGEGQLRYAYGVAIRDDKLYVADMSAAVILTYDLKGKFLGALTKAGVLSKPTDLKFHGRQLYVADAGLHQVLVLDAEGTVVRRVGGPGEEEGRFRFPNGIAIAGDGTLYVADSGNNRVQIFDSGGRFVKAIAGRSDSGLTAPRGITLGRDGTLYVVAGLLHSVIAFDAAGTERYRLGPVAGVPGSFYLPNGICLSQDGRLYVAESGNRRISVYQ